MENDAAKPETSSEAPTGEGGDDVQFELEAPPEREGGGPVEKLPAPRQGFLTRIFRRRDPNVAAQAGFAEMMGVMHSIKSNLELQSDAQARLLEALEHFPEAIDGLKNLDKMGEHQEEMLGLVRRQVEDSAEHGRQVAGSINRFDETLNRLDETSRSTADTMVGVAERSRASEDVLRTMLERSERRLTFLFGAMGLLCIVVIGGVLFLSAGGRLDVKMPSANPVDPSAVDDAFEAPAVGENGMDEMEDALTSSIATGEVETVIVPLDAESANTLANETDPPMEE